MTITAERLREILNYDPETGDFRWKVRRGYNGAIGKVAGSKNDKGYVIIAIGGKPYRAHRLAWLYMTGEWPKETIDHINGVRGDNRFSNVREATHVENSQNYKMPSHNRSGYFGVHYSSCKDRWVSRILVNKKRIYLGQFKTPEEAMKAYLDAKAKYHAFQPVPRELQGEIK